MDGQAEIGEIGKFLDRQAKIGEIGKILDGQVKIGEIGKFLDGQAKIVTIYVFNFCIYKTAFRIQFQLMVADIFNI